VTASPTSPRLREARFAELSPFEVYGLCRLRVDVFVVEQECPYPELDGRDVEPATIHFWYERDGDRGPEVLATIRVLDDGAEKVIGRVATAVEARGQGLAAALVRRGIELCQGAPVHLGAQAYLEGWYEQFGFRKSGPGYIEDGIPHVPMRRPGDDEPAQEAESLRG
jgi:predicted GNAT family N-acyltransferase